MVKRKKHQNKRPIAKMLVWSALLLCAVFAVLGWFYWYKSPTEIPSPAHTIVVIPEDENMLVETPDDDVIGELILHHEYFAADDEVLEQDVYAEDEIAQVIETVESSEYEESEPITTETEDVPNITQEEIIVPVVDVQLEVPLIAVVIDDMGINQKRTRDIISLQAPLTSSFLTYGKDLHDLVESAQVSGHEIIVHTPMEPKVKADLAPDTLRTDMENSDIENGIKTMLAKFADFQVRGINNHMGSKFTENREKLLPVMAVLKQRNMFFLDSKTTAVSVAEVVADENGVDYVARDVFLDNENDYDYIMKQLEKTERTAHAKGFAVAICHPKSQTYQALKDWIAGLEEKNIKLVHLSEIVGKINK